MAAKTLLDATNALLRRVNENAGDASDLTTLTDSARQHSIDLCVQVINEGIDQIYSASDTPLPSEQKQGTITLVTGTRSYALATDLIQLRYPMIDKTNSQFIFEFSGDYNDLLWFDPKQDATGLPRWGTISPVNGNLHLDCAPTSVENGRVYTYQYDKNLVLAAAADAVPFSDATFRAMVPVWVQLFKREKRNEFDEGLYRINIGLASRLMTYVEPRSSYSPR